MNVFQSSLVLIHLERWREIEGEIEREYACMGTAREKVLGPQHGTGGTRILSPCRITIAAAAAAAAAGVRTAVRVLSLRSNFLITW